MNLLAANLLATLLTYAAVITAAAWYLAPALARRPLGDALTILLWFHVFRYVALQIFSAADVGGLDASTTAQRVIAFGDLATAVLALIAIWILRTKHPFGRIMAWIVAVVGLADLISATATGISQELVDTASSWSWVILAIYAPILWVTIVMLFWQLYRRSDEPLYALVE